MRFISTSIINTSKTASMKKEIAIYFLVFFISSSFAQTGWNWAKNAESSNNSDGFSISKVVNDRVYVCGEFFGASITFGATTLTNAGAAGSNDLFLVCYDLAGNVTWAKSVGGSGSDFARSVAVDNANNIYIAGGFTSAAVTFGNTTLTNPGSSGTHDIFVTKYDPDGNVLWARSIGGKLDDKANCIATDTEGNVCITGWFGSNYMLLGSDSLKNQSTYGSCDVFVIKLNSSGEPLWARTATGQGEDYGYGITTDNSNNIYITGGSSSQEIDFSGIKIANPGREKMYIAKYSPKGDLLFAQSVGGSDNAEGTSITADSNGNIYITGKFSSSSITLEATTLTNAGAFDVYIAKYNSGGALQWATSAGGIADERGNSIITDAQGNAYITGWYSSAKITFGKTYLDNPGDKGTTHMFVAKYSPDGIPLWSESAKGKSDDWGNGITLDKTGNVYVTGGFDGIEMNFSTTKFKNPQGNDFYITKLLQP